MAEQSAFLTAFDEMQKKKGGFNAPTPQESVVDTVGQAPEVQSPFGQQAGLDAISRDFEVPTYVEGGAAGEQQLDGWRGAAYGSPRGISGNISEYISKNPNYEQSIIQPYINEVNAQRENDAILAGPNPLAAPIDLAAAPAVQAPQELTADSLGPVAFPGLQEQGMDTRLQVAGEEQQRMNEMSSTLSDGQIQKEREGSTVGEFVENAARKGFDYFFGAPTAEQAQNTLDTMPTDPAQRARLQATAAGTGSPSDLAKAGSFLFGRPEVEGDPNILGAQTPESTIEPFVGNTQTADMRGQDIKKSPIDPTTQPGQERPQFAERGSPQDFFLSQTNDGTTALSPEQITRGQEYAKQQGLNFDPTTGFSQSGEAPQVQAPQGLTTAGGQPLAEFLAGDDAAPSQQLDAQGRMIDPNVDRSSFEQESAAREARQAARPDFGEAVSDRDRRAARGDDMSDADRRDIAKANQRGASASDIARGDKVAEANGIDRKTGKPLGGVSGKELAETGKIKAETAKILSEIGGKSKELNLSPAEESRDKTAGTALAKWDDSGRATVTSNITALDSITKGLEDGQIKTRGFIDALPFGSDWARAIVNPEAQDAKNRVEGVIFQTLKETLGAQFTEREGKSLERHYVSN